MRLHLCGDASFYGSKVGKSDRLLAEKLQRHSLFLIFDCIIMLKNNKISDNEKIEILSWLESKQIVLQVTSDAESDEDEDNFGGNLDVDSLIEAEVRKLRDQIRSGEIAEKLHHEEMMDLEDELNRLRGF